MRDHLIGRRNGHVQVLDAGRVFQGRPYVFLYCPYPTRQAHRVEGFLFGQFKISVKIVDLVMSERKTELGLEYAHLVQVHVDHGFLQLCQS